MTIYDTSGCPICNSDDCSFVDENPSETISYNDDIADYYADLLCEHCNKQFQLHVTFKYKIVKVAKQQGGSILV